MIIGKDKTNVCAFPAGYVLYYNYSPDTTQPTSVKSDKTRVIYVCKNHQIMEEQYPKMKGIEPNACLFCHNWQNPSEYKNR